VATATAREADYRAMGDIVIELTKGLSPKKSMTFSSGTPAETFSLGQQGVWSVSGAGVSGVHAYLFFDGNTLFVASADPVAVTSVNGMRVTADWFPLAPPCEVAVGEARLSVSAAAGAAHGLAPAGGAAPAIIEDNPTMAMDPMKAMALMAPPVGTPVAVTGESTRFQPDPGVGGTPGMAGMPPGGAMPPGGPPATAPAPPGSAFAKIKADWAAATSSRRASILAIPGLFLGAYLLFAEDEAETVTSPRTTVARSATASASAAPTAPATRPTARPADSAAATPAPTPVAPATTAAPTSRPRGSKEPPPKTPQRQAADAIAAGDTAGALRLYEQLVKEDPNNAAYKEAVRILKTH
jgi:hypothetical protein